MDLEPIQRQARRRRNRVALGLLVGLPSLAGTWHLWVNRDRGAQVAATAALPFHREDLAPGLIHLQLRGQGYPLGYAEGSALRPEIQEMARFLREDMLGQGLLGHGARDWMLSGAWKLDAHSAPRFREELRGMSEATGVSYADLLLINTFDDLQHVSGCSSAVLEGSAEKPLLHGRNLDYPIPHLARTKVICDIETSGVRIRTIGFPGLIGALTGMSSRGLGLSSHTSASRRQQTGEASALLYRRMLEECRTLEDMQATLRAARRTMGNNLAISDGPRHRAVALEFDADAVISRPAEEGRVFVTNHFWSPELQAHQSAGWWSPQSGSQARVQCLAAALPAGTPPDAATLERALSQEGPERAWRTPANRGTVQSVVMEPATGRLWIATGRRIPVTQGGYLELSATW